MFRWPIRVKLIAGLVLVVGIMLTLMGGSMYGLHAFHMSNLTLMDQLRELGASKDVLQAVMQIDAVSGLGDLPADRRELRAQVIRARAALDNYYNELVRNSTRGNRADDGRDEFILAFLIDDDLTAILRSLDPEKQVEPLFERTKFFLSKHPKLRLEELGPWDETSKLQKRLNRLSDSASELPNKLHRDFLQVLGVSKMHYQSSRVIVWISAIAVLAMLYTLTRLIHRWVLHPVRLLHRGVRRVARGQFDYQINLPTGDEMQSLAEAFNDMTAQLRVMYADLERQVQERSKQLVRSERLAGVGFLAAGVAHEINNPLAAIAFCSEAMEGRLASLTAGREDHPDCKVVRNYARMIQEEAFRCKGITEKLLDFSRCNDIQRQRTDLVELVEGVVEMIRHMGKYRGKEISFAPREAVFAHADAQEIKQVVLNLVVNALDSMEPGGKLEISVHRAGGMAEMVFSDDGCGMTPDVLENIFEPFFTKRRTGKGTGLGLSITHRIVTQHGGEIAAHSDGEGRGATFTVRLPVQPAARPEADDDAPEPEARRAAPVAAAIALLATMTTGHASALAGPVAASLGIAREDRESPISKRNEDRDPRPGPWPVWVARSAARGATNSSAWAAGPT